MREQSVTVHMREWDEQGPLGEPMAGRWLDSTDARLVAERLNRSGMLMVDELRAGIRIRTTSHVGRISLGDLVIDVQPKLDQLPLSVLFGYAYGIRNLSTFRETPQYRSDASFVDIVVMQVVSESRNLLSRGLQKAYVRTGAELASPRGRLDLQRLASRTSAGGGQLPCVHYPRSSACAANRVLCAGLHAASTLARDRRLRGEARMLHQQVQDIAGPGASDLPEVQRFIWVCDRLSVAYLPIARLTHLLLEGHGVSMSGGEHTHPLPGFLFDMNRFFQALVSRLLHDALPECRMVDEYRLRHMLRYSAHDNPQERRSPTPRPDFAILSQTGRPLAILDAKYRDLWERRLPRDMLYQLCMYALSGVSNGVSTIVYPTSNPHATVQRIDIKNPVSNHTLGQVELRPLNLVVLAQCISEKTPALRLAAMRGIASSLVCAGAPRPVDGGTPC